MGRAFLRLLISKETELRRRYDVRWRLTGVATRRTGWLVDPDGLNPLAILNGHWPAQQPHSSPRNVREWVERSRADVVFEASSLNAATGEPAIEHMTELAEIARAEEEHWKLSHPEIKPPPVAPPRLTIESLLILPLASQRRLVQRWLEMNAPEVSLSFRTIGEALELARALPGKMLQLSGEWNLSRTPDELVLQCTLAARARDIVPSQSADYEYPLQLPGAVEIPELALRLDAQLVDTVSVPEKDCGQLLDIESIPKQVLIRNWRAGDRFWPSHKAAAKKVKELLSDRHVTGAEKKLWPVAVAEGQGIIWMRGFAVPEVFRAPAGSTKAIWIREIAGMM